jgi:hypothetical protein
VPAATTPCRAIPGLACHGRRRAGKSWRLDGGWGAGRRRTMRSRSRTSPRWWKACTGKRPQLDAGARGCRPPPHRTEPFPDSPALMGSVHWQSSTHGWKGCRSPLHHAEPFLHLPTTVGDVHLQSFALARWEKRNEEGASKDIAASIDVVLWAFALASNNMSAGPSRALAEEDCRLPQAQTEHIQPQLARSGRRTARPRRCRIYGRGHRIQIHRARI